MLRIKQVSNEFKTMEIDAFLSLTEIVLLGNEIKISSEYSCEG